MIVSFNDAIYFKFFYRSLFRNRCTVTRMAQAGNTKKRKLSDAAEGVPVPKKSRREDYDALMEENNRLKQENKDISWETNSLT